MNQADKDALQIVVKSDAIMEALNKVFYVEIAKALPNTDGKDEEVGQKYRAYCTAKEILNKAFETLKSLENTSSSGEVDRRHI